MLPGFQEEISGIRPQDDLAHRPPPFHMAIDAAYKQGKSLLSVQALKDAATLGLLRGSKSENPFGQAYDAFFPDEDQVPTTQIMSPEIANETYGIEGALKFTEPVSSGEAQFIHDKKLNELARLNVLQRVQGIGDNILVFGVEFITELQDPLGFASMFFPYFKGTSTFTKGFIEGAASVGISLGPGAIVGAETKSTFDAQQFVLTTLAGGTLAGGISSAVGKATKVVKKVQVKRAAKKIEQLEELDKEGQGPKLNPEIMNTAIAQIINNGKVNVEEIVQNVTLKEAKDSVKNAQQTFKEAVELRTKLRKSQKTPEMEAALERLDAVIRKARENLDKAKKSESTLEDDIVRNPKNTGESKPVKGFEEQAAREKQRKESMGGFGEKVAVGEKTLDLDALETAGRKDSEVTPEQRRAQNDRLELAVKHMLRGIDEQNEQVFKHNLKIVVEAEGDKVLTEFIDDSSFDYLKENILKVQRSKGTAEDITDLHIERDQLDKRRLDLQEESEGVRTPEIKEIEDQLDDLSRRIESGEGKVVEKGETTRQGFEGSAVDSVQEAVSDSGLRAAMVLAARRHAIKIERLNLEKANSGKIKSDIEENLRNPNKVDEPIPMEKGDVEDDIPYHDSQVNRENAENELDEAMIEITGKSVDEIRLASEAEVAESADAVIGASDVPTGDDLLKTPGTTQEQIDLDIQATALIKTMDDNLGKTSKVESATKQVLNCGIKNAGT